MHIFIQLWLRLISCYMIDQLCIFSFSCDLQTDQLLYDWSAVRIFIQLWLKSISYLIDQYRAYFHSVVTKIDQLLCDWSVMIWDAASTLGFCLSAAASNAGRQIWMKIIYIILHSLNSICKTSLVDMKLLFQLCLNDGLPLEGIWRLLWSITLADTSRDCHFLFFYNVTCIRIFLHG